MEPAAQADQFTGLIDGVGQLISQGNGTLTTGAIDFADGGSIQVLLGTLNADGAVSVGSLSVSNGATFGGLGSWYVSGPAVFQAGTTFDVTLNGTTPGTQYTQLVHDNSTTGINLGNSLLSGTVNYEYEAGDRFTIATGPLVQGTFQNAGSGTVLLGNNVPFAVSYLEHGRHAHGPAIRDDHPVEQLRRHDQSRPARHIHGDRQHPDESGHERDRQLRAGGHGARDGRGQRLGDGGLHDDGPAAGSNLDHRGVQRIDQHPRLDQLVRDPERRPLHDRHEPRARLIPAGPASP